jgi:hypothetical protein
MIYQCYYAPDQKLALFRNPVYCGFGLEPEVNPQIAENCPELEDPAVRLALTEYGAFLHLWRNPPRDGDQWIGFTSYRQTAKTPFEFLSKWQVRRALWRTDIVGWGFQRVTRLQKDGWRGAAAQAEQAHPGIMEFLKRLSAVFDFELPSGFFTEREVLFANYWVLQKSLFVEYMEWSWPKVEWCLRQRRTDPFLEKEIVADASAAAVNGSKVKGKAVGYVAERLFIIWYMLNELTVRRRGPLSRF